jgi:hypothetical protein
MKLSSIQSYWMVRFLFGVLVITTTTTKKKKTSSSMSYYAEAASPFSSNVIELTPQNWKEVVVESKHAVFVNICRQGCVTNYVLSRIEGSWLIKITIHCDWCRVIVVNIVVVVWKETFCVIYKGVVCWMLWFHLYDISRNVENNSFLIFSNIIFCFLGLLLFSRSRSLALCLAMVVSSILYTQHNIHTHTTLL